MVTRRGFLQGLAVGAGALQYGCDARSREEAFVPAPETPEPPAVLPLALPAPDPLVHLLKRTRFGITQADFEHARQIGAAAYLEEQLDPDSLSGLVELQAALNYSMTLLPPLVVMLNPEGNVPQASQQLRQKTLYLATYSARQLYEVMVDFWTNHFNIPSDIKMLGGYKPTDDREVIRPNALGRFRDLLHASAKSQAMIIYLDNQANTQYGPNENYARELMELHTLGRDGGYTEDDVKEVARCFTGWTLNPGLHTFEFNAAMHDDGQKTVLGNVIGAGGGQADGERVLDILAAHPSTARHLATKLARRFVADQPPAALIDKLAAQFISGGGDIKNLLRTLFADPLFYASWDAKLHRPAEMVAAAVRALAPSPDGYYGPNLLASVTLMGHAPHGWHPPNGYPDTQDYWLSTTGMLERWNFAAALAEVRNGQGGSYVQSIATGTHTPASLVDLLADRLLRRPLLAADRDALIAYVAAGDAAASLTGTALRDKAEVLAGLLLASPYFLLR